MSNILKGILNETSPHDYDSDWDYQDAVKSSGRRQPSKSTGIKAYVAALKKAEAEKAAAEKAAREKAQRDSDHDRLATGTNEDLAESFMSDMYGKLKSIVLKVLGKKIIKNPEDQIAFQRMMSKVTGPLDTTQYSKLWQDYKNDKHYYVRLPTLQDMDNSEHMYLWSNSLSQYVMDKFPNASKEALIQTVEGLTQLAVNEFKQKNQDMSEGVLANLSYAAGRGLGKMVGRGVAGYQARTPPTTNLKFSSPKLNLDKTLPRTPVPAEQPIDPFKAAPTSPTLTPSQIRQQKQAAATTRARSELGDMAESQEDNPWGDQGNFAGDKPANLGNVSMKNIQTGDTVKYLGQPSKVVAMSKDRKYSRIKISKGMGTVTQDVLTSDLQQLGRGTAIEENDNTRMRMNDYYDLADAIQEKLRQAIQLGNKELIQKLNKERDDLDARVKQYGLMPEDVAEGSKKEEEYGPEWDEKVKRIGQMAKEGPRKTVWDPVKRVYKTVPVKQSGIKQGINELSPGATGPKGPKDYGQPNSSRYIGGNKFVVGTTNNYVLTATIDKWGLEWDEDDEIWFLDSPGAAHIADASEGEIELPPPREQRYQIHDLVTDYLNERNSADLQKVAAYYGHSDDGEMATNEDVAEGSLNELSSDLLRRAEVNARQKSNSAQNQWDTPALKPVEKYYDTLSNKFAGRAEKVGQQDAVKKIASTAAMRKMGIAEGDNLKSNAMAALTAAKQHIQQQRRAELEQWEKDFFANNVRQPNLRQHATSSAAVSQPGERHSVLQYRLIQLNKAIDKQGILDKLIDRIDRKGLLTSALKNDVDTSLLVRDGPADNYKSLNQKLDKALEFVKNRLLTNKAAFAKSKKLEEEEYQRLSMASYLRQADALHEKMMSYSKMNDKPNYERVLKQYLALEKVAKQGLVAEGSLNEFAPPSSNRGDGGGENERSRRLRKLLEIAIQVAKEKNVDELGMIHAMNMIAGDDFFSVAVEGILPDITDKEYMFVLQSAYKTVKQGLAEGTNQGLHEFAPPGSDDREPDEEEILRQLAAQWWNGTEQQMKKAQQTLQAMGWEIGQDESGDDDAGVFVIRIGDEHGDSYIAFNHSDLEELNEAYNNYQANRTGFSRGQRDDERHDLDTPTQVWGLKINGKVWSKAGKSVTFTSKEAALNTRNAILKNRPDLEIGLVTKGGMAEEKQRLDPSCWKGYKKQGTKMKGGTRVNNCVPVKETNSSILEGIQQVDEINWKHAAAASAMALGSGGAHAGGVSLDGYFSRRQSIRIA